MPDYAVQQGLLVANGEANVTQHFHNNPSASVPLRSLVDALKFPSSGLREHAVEAASGGTCEWFLESDAYQDWVASEEVEGFANRLLWIVGKAGSGKSTLMKFAIGQTRERAAERDTNQGARDLILTHFFNARGNELERSTEGMYRTILVQLLQRLQHLSDHLHRSNNGWMPAQGGSWPIPALVKLLRNAVRELQGHRVVFFVDALDEGNDEEVQEMVDNFEDLIREAASSGQNLRVCFASRPYPYISAEYANYFRLDTSGKHREDIEKYIDTHLRIGQGTNERSIARRAEIKEQLMGKCSHVFLWVKLVIGMLNKEYRAGRPHHYDKWLAGQHGDLNQLYANMLERGTEADDEEDDQARLLCFQWVLYKTDDRFLFPRELWWGVQLGLGKEVDEIRDLNEEADDAIVERYIQSTSRGLVEVVHGVGYEFIQFIHESAREFVMSADGPLKQRTGGEEDIVFLGHLRLKECCESLLEHCRPHLLELVSWDDLEEGGYLFLPYVVGYILYHANEVQRRGAGLHDQTEWLENFYSHFIDCLWIFHTNKRPRRAVSLCDILLSHGYDALLQAGRTLLLAEARDARDCSYAPGVRENGGTSDSLQYALLIGAVEAVNQIVGIYLEIEQRHDTIQAVLRHLANTWKYKENKDIRYSHTELPLVSECGDELATFVLVALIPATVRFTNADADSLQQQANAGSAATLKFLLEKNIPTKFVTWDYHTYTDIRSWAADKGHEELLRTLDYYFWGFYGTELGLGALFGEGIESSD
ncbi:hypothetical protein NLU13_5748 [Sarocladium strictum]|uniref:NACHT domain-containing protein n=1 Tax=Sarocladium strictum TaxID=5046 RepID=A0AA39L7I7_SARSR|nr:hypothetical protein NLU13_5748 [Sarocladium strictum]